MRRFARQLRFLVSGLINTGVDFTVFALLLAFAGVSAFQANLLAFAAAVCCSYLLNRYWSFVDRRGGAPLVFALWMSAIALLSSWGPARLVVAGLPVALAKIAVTGLIMVLSHTVMNRLIFRADAGRGALLGGLAAVLVAGGLLLALPVRAEARATPEQPGWGRAPSAQRQIPKALPDQGQLNGAPAPKPAGLGLVHAGHAASIRRQSFAFVQQPPGDVRRLRRPCI